MRDRAAFKDLQGNVVCVVLGKFFTMHHSYYIYTTKPNFPGQQACESHEDKAFSQRLFVREESPCKGKLSSISAGDKDVGKGGLTIRRGATIQLTMMLNPSCTQILRSRKTWWSVSYLTLHRMGYIMTSNPMAIEMC